MSNCAEASTRENHVRKLSCSLLFVLFFFPLISFAEQTDTQIIDGVMRDIAINYLINEDRKLPKENRQKWEESFSECVDFKSLNNSMKQRIQDAVTKSSKTPIDPGNISYFGDKAVAFYLPKELTNVAISHLMIQKKVGELPKCADNPIPTGKEKITICTERSGNIIKAYWVNADTTDRPYHYSFKKTDKWRLTEIESPIGEGTLRLIGVWK